MERKSDLTRQVVEMENENSVLKSLHRTQDDKFREFQEEKKQILT